MANVNEIIASRLSDYIQSINPQVTVIGILHDELIHHLQKDAINVSIIDWIDSYFSQVDFEQSFHKKFVIVYNESFSANTFLQFHDWLVNKKCKLENIYFISGNTCGLQQWYVDYCRLMNQSKITIIDAPALTCQVSPELCKPIENYQGECLDKFENYFTYYGGLYSDPERELITAAALTLKEKGSVEFYGGFISNELEFIEEIENLSNFNWNPWFDQILQNFKTNTLHKQEITPEFKINQVANFDKKGAYAFEILRETVNNVPFTGFTEKTIRCFLHKRLPLPLSYRCIDNLESIGFKFHHDVIDYSYQHESVFIKRLQLAMVELERLTKNYTLEQLHSIIEHSPIVRHNYNYVHKGKFLQYVYDNIKQNLND